MDELTRRQLLFRSATAAASLGLAVSMLGDARRALAKVEPTPNATSDITTLNALLAAENDAIVTYAAGADLINADASAEAGTKSTVVAVASHFRQQHIEHANALKALITQTGGTPGPDVTAPSLPASFVAKTPKTVVDVIKLAADKEKAAATTYASVLKTISTPTAAKLIAAIGGVESQHFVVLYLLAEGLIAPTASTGSMATLVVPASFVVDVGLAGSSNLETNTALDAALAIQ